jgi:protein TonB
LARLPAILLASFIVHVLAVVGFNAMPGRPKTAPPPPERSIPVMLVQPHIRPLTPPPALGRPLAAPPKPVKAPPAPARMVQPRVVAERLPEHSPDEPHDVAPTGEVGTDATPGDGGRADGVVGGMPGGDPASVLSVAPVLIPARPSDLASVRAGIGRTLSYPPAARRAGWQGKVRLAFVLLADGRIRDLVVREGSGYEVLDAAAIAAVLDASPFVPPGMDVQIVIPVSFRIN